MYRMECEVGASESYTVTNGLLFGKFERRRTDCRPYVLLLLFGTAETATAGRTAGHTYSCYRSALQDLSN
jgi:hypothetical protein